MPQDTRRVAVVTGGSRGIGRAVVERFLSDGYDVGYCYRSRPADADAVERLAAEHGGRVFDASVDVTDPDAVRGFLEGTQERLGAIDALVTNAGIVRDGPLVTMGQDAWTSVIDTNLTGTYNVCRAAVFALMKQGRGSIVTVSSVAGVSGSATQANYAASKAGIIGFTRSLAKEVARFGVRANVVAPGLIATDMTDGMTAKARDGVIASIPLRRIGTAWEVADTVAFLASDRAAYITGQVIRVDGGIGD
ncbi:3-oxoacyl-ACP reductase FabG [Streptomyces sp. NPDC056254]|uniref:3-oxoacyl-ACP reductase FabG n=1 Tax=unclassified Streptomyces TaxID=2593676 RepID=UPI0004AAFD9F|nr:MULTISPECIES: 3-oxoacyl-ACP reductase FabG [unclassified Streptomyces]APU40706.1 beta-ketoacyl-ACP reductase [Streptomyces sp. TN58]KJK52993.1 3-oxoacyl-ACP reductase [Streptomyces sp. NRRL F-4428]